jgi:diadenosine tetraphosphate (Ap4A) HIT family hydrolase
MTFEHLWNGWRTAYVRSAGTNGGVDPSDDRSIFTRILDSGLPDDETHVIHRGVRVFAILNAFPYSVGHVLILPFREVPDLEDLDESETAELWATTTACVRVIKAEYRPEGLNVGINLGQPAGGSISQHLHVHVVPRWTGDANFMTAISATRTLPETLADTAQRLRTAWGSLRH